MKRKMSNKRMRAQEDMPAQGRYRYIEFDSETATLSSITGAGVRCYAALDAKLIGYDRMELVSAYTNEIWTGATFMLAVCIDEVGYSMIMSPNTLLRPTFFVPLAAESTVTGQYFFRSPYPGFSSTPIRGTEFSSLTVELSNQTLAHADASITPAFNLVFRVYLEDDVV